MKALFYRFIALASSLAMLLSPVSSHAAVTEAFSAGDLIKGVSFSSVYYFAPDGKRYVFPNEKTYFTWFTNFDNIKTISDASLGAIRIGGNVTYRPGVKMVKITTDPKVYAVDEGGVLRHVDSEQIAQTLYGLNWNNKIDDIPDPFFINYQRGTAILAAADFVPADVTTQTTTIAQDMQMTFEDAAVTIGGEQTGFVPQTITVLKGTTLTWTNRDNHVHTISSDAFNSNNIDPDGTYQRTFNAVGSFDYHCSLHPSMTATINVIQ